MKHEINEERVKYVREAILCVSIGTVVGLVVYQIFLYFNIAIVGWNLGLIFAPLAAGYVETILANRILGENIGAISAFILFIYTTFYSFILKNPTLGFNIITIASIFVILQAAFPTLINYIIFTLGLGTLLYIIGMFRKVTGFIYHKIKGFIYKHILKKPIVDNTRIEEKHEFDEAQSNKILNNMDFYFITSTDIPNYVAINIGQFHSTVIVEKAEVPKPPNPQKYEKDTLYNLKTGKDKCLIKLVQYIKSAGGNGVVDLDIQYSLIGLGGDHYQVTAFGMGILIEE